MRKFILPILLTFSLNAFAEPDLSQSIHCTYQKGQVLSDKESVNITNSTPLKWSFNGLLTENPQYMAGGDSERIFSVTINEGVAMYLPDLSGSHSFTVFKSGKSFWNKQWGIMGEISTQQYIGTCTN